MTDNDLVLDFFHRYSRALLARDEKAVAGMYAVPALILFPGQSVAVSDAKQTEEFFAGAWSQYDGVEDTTTDITVVAETAHSIWADVTWHHGNGARERLMYQLIDAGSRWKIATLTPLGP
ncbi:hypothetical protein ACFWYW_18270 [Nonomuraea sp. NPDC059023]|uniref:hypothetical protein n=1 Tax=unclassified Nonomuraea TaxID=2593643 RepID=UPI0036BD5649